MSKKDKWKPGTIRHSLFLRQGRKCCYCEQGMVLCVPVTGQSTNPRMATLEHLKRREDGGTDEPDNLAIACWDCNHKRGQIDWLTYKSWIMDNVVSNTTAVAAG